MGKNLSMKQASYSQWATKVCMLLGCLILFSFSGFGGGTSPKFDEKTPLNLKFEKATMLQVLNALKKETSLDFVYNHEEIQGIPLITKEFKNVTVREILDYCLQNTPYTYTLVNDVVIIKKRQETKTVDKVSITGDVKDADGNPLPGATVLLKGTSLGVATDATGKFKLEIPAQKEMILIFNFIGMASQTITVTKSEELHVVLKEDTRELEDVVVTGYYTQAKNAYTGELTTVKGEDLLKVSPTNLIQVLASLVPGLRIVENNEQGSNPNAIPEILIRGANSIMTENQADVNTPLIMLDGVEISIQELYDLDIYDIGQVTVLKDASAAVLYGDKAASGVILVERTKVTESKPRLSYNFTPNFSYPDLTSLRLCNAEQKLELERLAGLYDEVNGSLDPAYYYKLDNIRRGVYTDWPSKPLRWAFSHNHSVTLTGRGNGIEYRASGSFRDAYGVMKGDNRRNYGVNFSFAYHLTDKLTFNYRFAFTMTDSKASPYGDFGKYTRLNPYNPVYDEYGEYIKLYYFDPYLSNANDSRNQGNPLYDATLSSFNKGRNKSFSNYLSMRWDIKKAFFITGDINVNMSDSYTKVYVSPDDSSFEGKFLNQKGTYSFTHNESTNWAGKIALNYRLPLNETGNTVLTVNVGTDFKMGNSSSITTKAEGFLKDGMTDIKFASQYASTRPSGGDKKTREVGFYGTGSFELLGRYFLNGSYKSAGSSRFGSDHRFAPVWSAGIGWNVDKESFMGNVSWLNVLRLRFSVGSTANVTFSPYQAMTTYNYTTDLIHYAGIGAVPITMGNPDLNWQITMKYNWGLSATLFNERINIDASYYKNKTKDALMPISLPWSVGVSSVQVNMGKLENSGCEFAISAHVIKQKGLFWMVTVNGSHTMDKLTNVSTALKSIEVAQSLGARPSLMFQEGGSQFGIHAMRTAGIDPASGKEIFINSKGEYTFDYDKDERVEVGNSNPILEGSIFSSLSYKGFTLNITTGYKFGGDAYNNTLADKVENINPWENVDRRAFTDRWKEPGDLKRFLGIPESKSDNKRYSERFVERDNLFEIRNISINYEFKPEWLKRFGVKRLNVGFGMNDIARFSSMKLERGTSYPFERSFNITFRPTF